MVFSMIKMQWMTGDDDISDCHMLRKQIFTDEQGLIDEPDEFDAACMHLLITDNNLPVGAARIYRDKNIFHAGRICLIIPYRNNGIGRLIMNEIENKVRKSGAAAIELGAQEAAEGFYLKLGYLSFGEPFYEQGCRHVLMRKELI